MPHRLKLRLLASLPLIALLLLPIAHFGAAGAESAQPPIVLDPLGQLGGSGSAALTVIGSRAYLGSGPRLLILDVSQPAAPVVLGRSPLLSDIVQGVSVAGSLAYVVSGAGGLTVLDVGNPAAPSVRGHLATAGFAKGVSAANGLVAVADYGRGLTLIDAS
ncbi:MAG: hypothetical protein WAV66_19855, partial [Anaerolineae bacterium]